MHLNKLFTLFFLLFISINAFCQMPPHPDLLKKIKSGEIDKSVLPDYEEMRAKGIDAPWSEIPASRLQENDGTGRIYGPAKPYAGQVKALVILVSFSDNPSKLSPSIYDDLLFADKPGTLNAYYKETTYGQIDIITLDMPSKLGWQTAPQPYKYYVGAGKGTGAYPNNSQKLTEDIVKLVDPLVDFSKYDNNGDGTVDALFIIHAGSGAEATGASSTQIWSHAWSTSSPVKVDGVTVSRYSVEPEVTGTSNVATMGVFAHELGHALFGLPDLYDTDDSSEGLGNWSLMAGGSWNGQSGSSPSHLDAWCKMQLGYVTPISLITDSLSLSIPNVETNPTVYRLWKNGPGVKEFFLLENRQKKGFDSYLPNSGLLIFHVDNAKTNNTKEWYPGNTAAGHYKVALVQADGTYDLERKVNRGDVGDTYPGNSRNSTFSSTSFPSSLDYNLKFTNIALNNISENNNIITLDAFVNDNLNPVSRQVIFYPHDLNNAADTAYSYLINTAAENIVVTDISLKKGSYKLAFATLPKTLRPNDTLKIGVIFKPTEKGEYNDTIIVARTNSKIPKVFIAVSGKAYKMEFAKDKILYSSSGSKNNGEISVVNQLTYIGQNIGASGYSTIKSLCVNPLDKILYGLIAYADSANLVFVNPTFGDSYIMYTIKIGNLTGIAFNSKGELLGATKAGNIYSINYKAKTFNLLSAAKGTINNIAINPLNDELWASNYIPVGIKDIIYRINSVTGETVNIGRTGLGNLTNAIYFDENGNLFGTTNKSDGTDVLFQIDKSSGVGTVLGSTGIYNITGLAYSTGKVSDVNNNLAIAPGEFKLLQNYPNPFNPSTQINYSLPASGKIKLTVHNLLGETVKVLSEGDFSAGNYTVNWNSENSSGVKVSSGIYFYTINFVSNKGDAISESRKMVLLK